MTPVPPPDPDPSFLAAQIRWACGRGLPVQAAEDLVFEAWEHATAAFDPARGRFEPFMQTIVCRRCAGWWRKHQRTVRAHAHLRLLPDPQEAAPRLRAQACQERMLEALDDEERAVFAAWALQKHLGKGQVQAAELGESIGLEPGAFENAKRRLKYRLGRLLTQFGWSIRDLLHGDDDVDQTG